MGSTLLSCCGGRPNKSNGLNEKESNVDKDKIMIDGINLNKNYSTDPDKLKIHDSKIKKYSSLLNKNIHKQYTQDSENNITQDKILTHKEFIKSKTLPLKIFHENEEISNDQTVNKEINKEINKQYRLKAKDFNDSHFN